ncbi:MAG: hypothetical protein WBB29_04320 [Geitlerinemataceae cyanobacterium]
MIFENSYLLSIIPFFSINFRDKFTQKSAIAIVSFSDRKYNKLAIDLYLTCDRDRRQN